MGLNSVLTRRLVNYSDPTSFASRLRAKRVGPLRDLIDQAYEKHGHVRIVDVGGTATIWRMVGLEYLRERKAKITLLNLGYNERSRAGAQDPLFELGIADGCNMPEVATAQFHIAHSNSVLEHVGSWSDMQNFAREFARVSDAYFLQTPNYWFPIEPHALTPFLHWLPKPWRVSLVMRFALGHWPRCASVSDAVACVESARLLDRKMFASLFPGARVVTERLFGLPKSLLAIRPLRE